MPLKFPEISCSRGVALTKNKSDWHTDWLTHRRVTNILLLATCCVWVWLTFTQLCDINTCRGQIKMTERVSRDYNKIRSIFEQISEEIAEIGFLCLKYYLSYYVLIKLIKIAINDSLHQLILASAIYYST